MALGDVDIAIAWVRHDIVRVSQGFGRISPHARLPQRHQYLAFGAELDDHASLVAVTGKLGEFVWTRRPCVGHPYIAILVDMDAMWPDKHSTAKAPDLLA